MSEPAWTSAQVARRASVSTRTVQRWVRNHGLPARRVGPRGRTLRIEPAEFEAWWAAQTTRPTAPPPAPKRRTIPAPVEGYGPWPHPDADSLRHIA